MLAITVRGVFVLIGIQGRISHVVAVLVVVLRCIAIELAVIVGSAPAIGDLWVLIVNFTVKQSNIN